MRLAAIAGQVHAVIDRPPRAFSLEQALVNEASFSTVLATSLEAFPVGAPYLHMFDANAKGEFAQCDFGATYGLTCRTA